MKKILDLLSEEMQSWFEQAGYDRELGRISVSNRPDLCEFQCNGAMAGAKKYKKAPLMIANEIVAMAEKSQTYSKVEVVPPGFLNINVKESVIKDYLKQMEQLEKFGVEEMEVTDEVFRSK